MDALGDLGDALNIALDYLGSPCVGMLAGEDIQGNSGKFGMPASL